MRKGVFSFLIMKQIWRCFHCWWKWGPFTRRWQKYFWWPTHARLRYCGSIYWDRNRRLPPGFWCLISICPTVEKSSLVVFRHRTKASVQKPVPSQNLVQFSPRPHPASISLVQGTLWQALYPGFCMEPVLRVSTWSPHLDPMLGAQGAARPTWLLQRENIGVNEHMGPERMGARQRENFLKLGLYSLGFGMDKVLFQNN